MKHTKIAALLALFVGSACVANAQWTTLNIPSLSQPYGVGSMGHFADGRYLYAASGEAWIQDAWGESAFTQLAAGPYFDAAFVVIASDSLAYMGSGGWGATDILTLDPSSPASPGYAAWGDPVQNYMAVTNTATSLYLAGNFGSATNFIGSPNNAIGIFDGVTNRIVIDNISAFSGGFDRDALGNLYVGNADDNGVYFFSAAQLAATATNGPLLIGDGEKLFTFQSSSSVAVDDLGRIWAAGYATTGIEVYDPLLGLSEIFIPGETNENYQVMSFDRDGTNYVGWINNAAWDTGAAMVYGYSEAGAIAVPEPTSVALLALAAGACAFVSLRRKHRRP